MKVKYNINLLEILCSIINYRIKDTFNHFSVKKLIMNMSDGALNYHHSMK